MDADQSQSAILIWATGIAGVISVVVPIFIKLVETWWNGRTAEGRVDVDQRKALSDDERVFRETLLEENKRLREETAKLWATIYTLQAELRECIERHTKAEEEISELRREFRGMKA